MKLDWGWATLELRAESSEVEPQEVVLSAGGER